MNPTCVTHPTVHSTGPDASSPDPLVAYPPPVLPALCCESPHAGLYPLSRPVQLCGQLSVRFNYYKDLLLDLRLHLHRVKTSDMSFHHWAQSLDRSCVPAHLCYRLIYGSVLDAGRDEIDLLDTVESTLEISLPLWKVILVTISLYRQVW